MIPSVWNVLIFYHLAHAQAFRFHPNPPSFVVSRAAAARTSHLATTTATTTTETETAPVPETQYLLLAGDLGGTNTRLALHHPTDDYEAPIYAARFRNSEFVDTTATVTDTADGNGGGDNIFLTILQSFLEGYANTHTHGELNHEIVACFAVAGPVTQNAASLTNLPNVNFTIDGNTLQDSNEGLLSKLTSVRVMNDFVGQGYGVTTIGLDDDDDDLCIEVIPGSLKRLNPEGVKCCLGAGTGLGECFLTPSEQGYDCYPSEGGHAEFVPRTALELELREFLKRKFDEPYRVSVERIVSGIGLANVYEFLAEKFPEEVQEGVQLEFVGAGDQKGEVVTRHAKDCGLCAMALDVFASTFGTEAGTCALNFIPTGGLFLTGGIPPKLLASYPELLLGFDSPFQRAFGDKGRLSPLLETIPVFLVKTNDLGIRGARVVALQDLKRHQRTHRLRKHDLFHK